MSSSWALVTGGSPIAACIGATPRPKPRVNRPPLSRCMVEAMLAVTRGWRVLWLVAAVAMPSVVVAAAAAPHSVAASLSASRSETNAEPRPSASACRTSASRSCGESLCPASV